MYASRDKDAVIMRAFQSMIYIICNRSDAIVLFEGAVQSACEISMYLEIPSSFLSAFR